MRTRNTAHREDYRARIKFFQKSILIVQLMLMVIGVGIFALGVTSRSILRVTRAESIPTVRWTMNLMVSAGLAQMAAAAYDIFSGFSQLLWPVYVGMGITFLAMMLEVTAIGWCVYLYSNSDLMVNEDKMHPWYWVECLLWSSCYEKMLHYLHSFILPQVLLAFFTVILQCVAIILLALLISVIAEHLRVLHHAQERYHERWQETKFKAAKPSSPQNQDDPKRGDPTDRTDPEEPGTDDEGRDDEPKTHKSSGYFFSDQLAPNQVIEMLTHIQSVVECHTMPASDLQNTKTSDLEKL